MVLDILCYDTENMDGNNEDETTLYVHPKVYISKQVREIKGYKTQSKDFDNSYIQD